MAAAGRGARGRPDPGGRRNGLYDGEPSAADLAVTFGLPVAAVIDAGAMAQTFGAGQGLKEYRAVPFAGVFANRVASAGHARMLADSLPSDIPLLAVLPEGSAAISRASSVWYRRASWPELPCHARCTCRSRSGKRLHGDCHPRCHSRRAIGTGGPLQLLAGRCIAVARRRVFLSLSRQSRLPHGDGRRADFLFACCR